MSKGWINYGDREDMQDDTYKLISELLTMAMIAYNDKDANRLHSSVDSLFILTHSRMEQDEANKFNDSLKEASQAIYGNDPDAPEDLQGQRITEVIDNLREILMKISRVLDDKGILFKMKVDPSTMAIQNPNT